ncbi:MAG: hypothetical protein A4E65_03570 [Syntrophorhabdus sp. PtaU1.Bin153]|nr:MAG: hypothetical protein A4E65_03570 [Syntrophorhabdus sp. PtaU1.Bin153]
MAHSQGLLALFLYVDDLLAVLRVLKAGDFRIETVFSPIGVAEVQEILGKKPSITRLITLLGSIVGGVGVMALAVYAHLSFNLITGGKPVLPWVPWVVICFEGAILGAVLSSVTGWVLKGRLPCLKQPPGYDVRFSRDRFGILVACTDAEGDSIREFLEQAGAEEVRHVAW